MMSTSSSSDGSPFEGRAWWFGASPASTRWSIAWRGAAVATAVAALALPIVNVGRQPYRAGTLITRLAEVGDLALIDARFDDIVRLQRLTAWVLIAAALLVPHIMRGSAIVATAGMAFITWWIRDAANDSGFLSPASGSTIVLALAVLASVAIAASAWSSSQRPTHQDDP